MLPPWRVVPSDCFPNCIYKLRASLVYTTADCRSGPTTRKGKGGRKAAPATIGLGRADAGRRRWGSGRGFLSGPSGQGGRRTTRAVVKIGRASCRERVCQDG